MGTRKWGGPVANRRVKGGVSSYRHNEDRILDQIDRARHRQSEEQRSSLVKELLVGQVREGVVKNITDFGAFIDLGGMDGLLHIKNMSWHRVGHPTEMVGVGDKMDVKVLDIDWDRKRLSLGLKQLMPNPWTDIAERYPVGARVRGKVVSITNYGAFVELQKGVEGLIHISEMSWTRNVRHPSKLVAVGDFIETVILKVDSKDKKIALGMKQMKEDPWPRLSTKYPVGSKLSGVVRNLTSFGAFVEVESGIDGLVHVSDMSWTKRVEHPSEVVREGDDAEVIVLDVDADKRRVSLGIKQLLDDPWPALVARLSKGHEQEGIVVRIQDGGVVVDLGDDVEGFAPGSVKTEMLEEHYRAGETVPVRVIASDARERRIVLEVLGPRSTGGSTVGDQETGDASPGSPTHTVAATPGSWDDIEALLEEVTTWLIEELKQARSPWTQPWRTHRGTSVRIGGQLHATDWPSNIRSPGYRYNPRNQTLLSFQMHKRGQVAYRSNLYVTPDVLEALGVKLPSEEPYFVMTSFPVGHASRRRREPVPTLFPRLRDDEGVRRDGDDSRDLYASDFRTKIKQLYHVEQIPDCEKALGFSFVDQHHEITYDESDRALTALKERHDLRVVEGKPYATYDFREDIVSMPAVEQFSSMRECGGESHYWSTMWHEIVHWTGHSSRLKRPGKLFRKMTKDQQYAVEELVAESGAAYLCSHFGIEGRLQHGAYLGSWLESIETDRWRTFMRALGDAQKATKWIIDKTRRK